MNFVVPIVGIESEVIEWDERRSNRVGAPLHLRSEETPLVSLRSLGYDIDGGVDDKDGFFRCLGIRA